MASALAELVAWTEAFAKTVLAAPSASGSDLALLFDACTFLADRPEQSDRSEDWTLLAERSAQAMPAGEARSSCLAQVHIRRSQACLDRGDEQAARVWAERALEEKPRPDLEFFALFTLAEAERRAGAKIEALGTLDRARTVLSGIEGTAAWLAQIELIRAQTELDLGHPDFALAALERAKAVAAGAIDAAKRAGADDADARAMSNAAREFEMTLLLAVDRSEEVVNRLWPKGNAPDAPLSPSLELRLAIALADWECVNPGSPPRAVGLLERVLEDASLPADERRIARVALVDFHLRQGDDAAAARQLQGARDELARLSSGPPASSRARERAELEAYASCLMRHGPVDEAARRRQLAVLRGAFADFLAQLRGNEARPGSVGYLHFVGRRFVLDEVIALSVAVEGDQVGFDHGLQALIEAQELGSLARALSRELGLPAPTAEEVRLRLVRADGGTLVFVPDYHRTLVLVLDGRGTPLCATAAARGEWLPAVEAWSRLVCTPPGTKTETAREEERKRIAKDGERVAALVLPAAVRERMAKWKSATIVGADLMEGLPFEALPWGDGETLGTRLAVDHLPSLPVGVRLAQRRERRERPPRETAGLWLVAAPLLADQADPRLSGLAEIPFSEKDRLALQRPYPKVEGSWFVGKDATRAALQDPRMSLAGVLQITAHGVALPDRERPAALALRPSTPKDDGLLDCEAVERLRVPDTVVLSACGPARGAQRLGEDGLQHLGGAFLRAGASCVVLSSHAVEAQAMQALMVVFHRRLRANDAPAEALRVARKELSQDPRFRHPFYHSLVLAVGLGQAAR